jgi:uncharacterized membrane protein HdeD (DUF308 family)
MDATHLHLLINHVPILTTVFAVLILLWGIIRSNKSFQQLAMVGFIIAGILSIVALQSGEGAEDTVENLPGVTESYIHDHEEAAEITNWIAVALAVVSGVGFAISRFNPGIMKMYLYVLLTGGIVSAGMFSYTAYLGGQIRHTEIRPETTAGQSGAVASTLNQIEGREERT